MGYTFSCKHTIIIQSGTARKIALPVEIPIIGRHPAPVEPPRIWTPATHLVLDRSVEVRR